MAVRGITKEKVAEGVYKLSNGYFENEKGERLATTGGGKGSPVTYRRDPNGKPLTEAAADALRGSRYAKEKAPTYSLGYDTELFPYFDDKWLEKNLPELKKEVDQYDQVKRANLLGEYFHRVGMPNATQEQRDARDQIVAFAKNKYLEEAKNPSQALVDKFNGDKEAARAYAAEQVRASTQEYYGEKQRDDKALFQRALMAAALVSGTFALQGLATAGTAASGSTLIGSAGADTLGVSVAGSGTAAASTGTGIGGWLSSTFGIPIELVNGASIASSANSIISGGEGISSIGGAAGAVSDAASGASTFSQILSGVSTVGKVTSAVGGIIDLVGGSGAADAYSTFLNADAQKAAYTSKARDYSEQAESYDYLASQSGRNRQVSLQNYVAEQQRLAVESERIARANKRAIGQTTAAYGAAGVALESGSVQEVLMDSAAEGELDLAIENFNSKQKQRNYLIEADSLAEEEAFNKKNAARARENANLSLEAGNSISDMLRKQGTVQGVEAGINIIGGAGKAINTVLDLF